LRGEVEVQLKADSNRDGQRLSGGKEWTEIVRRKRDEHVFLSCVSCPSLFESASY
jgi:hypothetical protein